MSADRIRTVSEGEPRRPNHEPLRESIRVGMENGELIRSGDLVPMDWYAEPTGIPGADKATQEYWSDLDSKRRISTDASTIKTMEPKPSRIKTLTSGIRTVASKIRTVSDRNNS